MDWAAIGINLEFVVAALVVLAIVLTICGRLFRAAFNKQSTSDRLSGRLVPRPIAIVGAFIVTTSLLFGFASIAVTIESLETLSSWNQWRASERDMPVSVWGSRFTVAQAEYCFLLACFSMAPCAFGVWLTRENKLLLYATTLSTATMFLLCSLTLAKIAYDASQPLLARSRLDLRVENSNAAESTLALEVLEQVSLREPISRTSDSQIS